jgi:hypothetical protein
MYIQSLFRPLNHCYVMVYIFFRTRDGRVRFSIKIEENAKEWLQHYTSLLAHNTLLQHQR